MTTIKLKNGSGAPATSDLVQGEPALDLTNKRLYTENASGAIIEVGTNPSTLTVDTTTLVVDATNNRVGVGTASPARTLDVSSGATGVAITTKGSGTGSYITFQDGTTTNDAKVRVGAVGDNLTLFGGGTERMRIDSAGNLGIGATSPSSYSSASELVVDTGLAGGITVVSDSTSGGYGGLYFADGTTGDEQYRGFLQYNHNNSGTDEMLIGTAGATRMTIDSSGRVSIGATSTTKNFLLENPSTASGENVSFRMKTNGTGSSADAVFEMIASTTGECLINFGDSNDANIGNIRYGHSTNAMRFITNTNEAMRIDSSGQVGIGTTSPNELLNIHENSSDGSWLRITNSTTGVGASGLLVGINSNEEAALLQYEAKPIKFSTSATERMRIDSSGNLLVGTTSNSLSSAPGFGVLPAGNAASSPFVFSSSDSSVNSQITWVAYSRGASAYRFYVGYGGTIYATSTSITAISDESLKENVRDLDKGLDTINALQPRRFDWKNGDGNDIMGFVAQEVEEVMPELVHDYQYNDEETKLGLRMGDMVPSMVKAIQELSAQVNELKAEVAALKGA